MNENTDQREGEGMANGVDGSVNWGWVAGCIGTLLAFLGLATRNTIKVNKGASKEELDEFKEKFTSNCHEVQMEVSEKMGQIYQRLESNQLDVTKQIGEIHTGMGRVEERVEAFNNNLADTNKSVQSLTEEVRTFYSSNGKKG